jgi:hypothetical protein
MEEEEEEEDESEDLEVLPRPPAPHPLLPPPCLSPASSLHQSLSCLLPRAFVGSSLPLQPLLPPPCHWILPAACLRVRLCISHESTLFRVCVYVTCV